MVENHKQAADAFWEAWTPEFIKSVEMFAGQTVTIEPGADADTAQTLGSEDSILWQGQVFEREGTGTVWIGTPTAACRALTAGSAEDDAGGEALYRELLRQSFEGAAHILSSGLTPRIVCKRAIEDRGRPLDLALVRSAWMKGPDQGRVPLLLGLESGFAGLLVDQSQAVLDAPHKTTPLMDRLVDLELPVAVVLGRAKLQIRDVLKLTAGSLVELDRRAGDFVDIVVHNSVVARGEVVSVGGNYGVRIQEVISRSDRFALQAAASRPPRGTIRPTVN